MWIPYLKCTNPGGDWNLGWGVDPISSVMNKSLACKNRKGHVAKMPFVLTRIILIAGKCVQWEQACNFLQFLIIQSIKTWKLKFIGVPLVQSYGRRHFGSSLSVKPSQLFAPAFSAMSWSARNKWWQLDQVDKGPQRRPAKPTLGGQLAQALALRAALVPDPRERAQAKAQFQGFLQTCKDAVKPSLVAEAWALNKVPLPRSRTARAPTCMMSSHHHPSGLIECEASTPAARMRSVRNSTLPPNEDRKQLVDANQPTMAERAEEFDMIVQGRRVGWWAAEALPFTYTPEPTPKHPNPPQFTCNFHPYTIFGTPAPVTWNGTYLQFCHHQPGQRNPIPTTYFHRQLATDHHHHHHPNPTPTPVPRAPIWRKRKLTEIPQILKLWSGKKTIKTRGNDEVDLLAVDCEEVQRRRHLGQIQEWSVRVNFGSLPLFGKKLVLMAQRLRWVWFQTQHWRPPTRRTGPSMVSKPRMAGRCQSASSRKAKSQTQCVCTLYSFSKM